MSPAQALPRSQWLVALGLVAVVGLFWVFRILLTGTEDQLLTSDIYLYYLPVYETLYGALLEGRLPLWNPYQLCGIPQLASLQAGFFYPGHLLYLLLPVKLAFGVSGVAHLAFAAIAMWALARRLGLGLTAAVAAAVVLALRGRYPGMVFFPNMLEAAAWLPLGAIAVVGIVRDRSRRSAALLAGCTGLSLLAGYPQVSVYVVYSWGALLLGLALVDRLDWRSGRTVALLFSVAIVLGAALAAIQLLPGWELTAEGTRSPGPLTRAQQFPFGWWDPRPGPVFAKTLRAPFPVLPLSLGVVCIGLLPLALVGRGRRMLALFCLGMAILVLLFAMGPATPAFDWISQLPALGWFRLPRRSLFMLDFFVAIAAGIGVQAIFSLARRRLGDDRGGRLGAGIAWGVVFLLALEIFVAEPNRQLYFVPRSDFVYAKDRELYDPITTSGERVWIRSPGIDARLPPKVATYFEMRSVGDYEPLNLRRQADYFTYLMEGQLAPMRAGRPYSGRLHDLTAPRSPGALRERGRLLDVAGVGFFLVGKKAAARGELAEYIQAHDLEETAREPGLVLLRNPHALPRAYAVYQVEEAPDTRELMEAMSDPSFDPLEGSYAEGIGGELGSARPGEGRRGSPARIVVDEETVVEVEASLDAPGMLVLSDSFYPGWRATVDGEEHEILAANHLFRGVLLPAGSHRVRFEYRPWTLPAGATISAFALLSILGLGFHRRGPGELPAAGRSDSMGADDDRER